MGTKIMVIKLRELIRTLLFIVAGIALIVMLIYFIFPKNNPSGALYEPGIYTASIVLDQKPIEIAVSVTDKEIKSCKIIDIDDIQAVFYPLLEPTMSLVESEILKNQTVKIDLPPDSEMTGKLLLDAVDSALLKAKVNF